LVPVPERYKQTDKAEYNYYAIDFHNNKSGKQEPAATVRSTDCTARR
jgi:hypothetical protein